MAQSRLNRERDILVKLKSGITEVIWNERAIPRKARRWTGSVVISWPSNTMRPASGRKVPWS